MMENVIHVFLQASYLMFFAGCIALGLAGLFWLAASLLGRWGDAMLRQGLRVVRISNWRYWSARMEREGVTAMSKFYAEHVAQRKPHTVSEFVQAEREADEKESNSVQKDAP